MKKLCNALLCAIFIIACNCPLYAQGKDDGVLRILAIGNSFSDDGMEYIPALFANLGVENVELARLYVGGCSLKQHLDFYKKNESPYIYTLSKAGENRWVEQTKNQSLKATLEQGEWDIITLQQRSGYSGDYDSFEPYLGEIVRIIKDAQPSARIAWHMTWSYSTNSKHNDFSRYENNSQKMLDAIFSATTASIEAHPEIEVVIPCGTAIQSLRKSAINNHPQDLTRDGYHMGFGAGRYALACTWYESLIEPYTNISMAGNTVRINSGNVAVTPIIAAYCQKAARMAAQHNFAIKEVKHVGKYMRKAKRQERENKIK